LTYSGAADDTQNLSSSHEDTTTLTQFALQSHGTIYVADTRPVASRPNYVDTSQVEKFNMDDEAYSARSSTVMAWKKEQKLGRFDPEREIKIKAQLDEAASAMAAIVQQRGIAVGQRCRVGDTDRFGDVRYVGLIPQLPGAGVWVGVAYDEPVGKNDGSAGGHRYFTAQPKYGGFVRPDRVQIGDFKPLDLDSDIEM
jgi:tubulin-folding cofactor B